MDATTASIGGGMTRQTRRRIHRLAVEAARQDPIALARFAMSDPSGRPWEIGQFHIDLQQILTDNPLAVIHAPIEHGKTEQVSILRVLWELGRNPDLRVGIVTGTGDLARKIVHAIRTHCESNDRLHEVFPHLRPGRRWTGSGFDIAGRTRPGAKDFSVSVNMIEGRGTLGARFDLVVLDDPNNHQNTGTAEARQKAYDWIKSTLIGRGAPRMWVIGTAWNLDDLLFRLVADGWAHFPFKATTDGMARGAPLWPRPRRVDPETGEVRFPGQASKLEELLRRLGEREYSRQCDNDPITSIGTILRRQWFLGDADHSFILDSVPFDVRSKLRCVRFWDLAATDGSKAASRSKAPCYTAGVKLGTYDGLWYLLDVRRIQGAPDAVEQLIRNTAWEDTREVAIRIEQEPASHSIHLEHQYARHVLLGFNFEMVSPHGDKATRALPVGSAAQHGLFRLIKGDWVTPFLDEAESFPFGAFKDQVDALSGAFTFLSETSGKVSVVANTWSAR